MLLPENNFTRFIGKCVFVMAKLHINGPGRNTNLRLELEAALDTVKMSRIIKQELELQECQCFFWTDSAIVLHSFHADCKRFSLFPRNRLQRILSHTYDWGFVSRKMTPLITLHEEGQLHLRLMIYSGLQSLSFCN